MHRVNLFNNFEATCCYEQQPYFFMMLSLSDDTEAASCTNHSKPLETAKKCTGHSELETSTHTATTSASSFSTQSARRPSLRKTSIQRLSRRLLRRYHGWKSAHLYLGRYSLEKLLDFEEYQRVATPARVFVVVALTPLTGFIAVLLFAVNPLRSPLLPATSNGVYFMQSWLSFSVATFAMLLYMKCTLGVPRNIYSHRQCALISVLTAGANELVMFFVSVVWKFPIPLRAIFGSPSYAAFFVLFHATILRSRLRYYRQKIREYLPLYFTQLAIFIVFEGVATAFKSAPALGKVAIAVLFPILRTLLKGLLRTVANALQDISTEVTMCVVEVFGSFFQSVCLQSACSLTVSGVFIVANSLQSVLELMMYLDRKFVVDGRQATQTAFKIVESALFPGALTYQDGRKVDQSSIATRISRGGVSVPLPAPELVRKSSTLSNRPGKSKKIVCCLDSQTIMSLDIGTIELGYTDRDSTMRSRGLSMPLRRTIIDDVEIAHRHHGQLLSQTLYLLNASEVIVSAQYFDFACSVYFGLYTLVAYYTPNAKYIVIFIGLSHDEFWRSILMLTIYAGVGGLVFCSLFSLVRSKFGFSTLYLLGFVLEKYWMGVQGKIIGCITLISILNSVHVPTVWARPPS